MIRVSGVILPPKKHICIALMSVFGVGKTRALKICDKVGIDPATVVANLKDDIVTAIQQAVSEYEVEGDLRRRIAMNIKRLRDIKCYRGMRHRRNLPVRGQNTRNNSRTRKGRKKQQGGSKK